MREVRGFLRSLADLKRQISNLAGLLGEAPRCRRTYVRRIWTEAQIAILRRDFARTLTPELAKTVGHSLSSTHQKARKLGLAKDPDFVLETNRQLGRALARHPNAIASQFKAGDGRGGFVSEAARRAFLDAGKKTRFKKGNHFTNTWKPVGTETLTKEGYLVRKVSDRGGYNSKDWKMVHVLTWEAKHGPVPPGHVVIFKDGNKRNFADRNLKLVSLAENMRRNTIHRYPPELKKTIRALAKLNRIIRRKNEKQN